MLSPGVANLSGASASINRAGAQLQQNTVDLNAFAGEGAALAEMGGALSGVGLQATAIIADFQGKINRARDTGKLAEADGVMQQKFADFQQERTTLPETEWVKVWQEKKLPELQKQLESLELSGTAARQLEPAIIKYQSTTSIQLQTDAWKQTTANSRDAVLVAAGRASSNGDFESAEVHLSQGVDAGLITRGDADILLLKMEEDQRAQEIHQAVADDPFGVEEDIAAALKGEGSQFFPWIQKPEQLRRIQSMAQQEANQVRRETAVTLDNEILTGALDNEEEIRQRAAAGGLGEKDTRSLISSLYVEQANTPEGQAKYMKSFVDIQDKVAAYDSKQDPKDEKYMEILRDIRSSVVPGEREALLKDLKDARTQGRTPSAEMRTTFRDAIGELRKSGFFGDDGGVDEKTKKLKDPTKFLDVETKRAEAVILIEGWLKKNPSASPEEAKQQFKSIIQGSTATGISNPFMRETEAPPGFWKRFFGSEGDTSLGVPSPALEIENLGASATPARQQQQTAMKQTPIQKIVDQVAQAAKANNLPVDSVLAIVAQESNFNPSQTVAGSSAQGLFQLLKSERSKAGLTDGAPVDKQIAVGMRKMADNYNAAKKALGREPTTGELYVIYYQGIGAGPRILANPEKGFRETLSGFGRSYADKVIKANPWLKGIKTNAEFIAWSEERMKRQKQKLGIS